MLPLHLPHAISTSQTAVGAPYKATVAEPVIGKNFEGRSRRPI